jgi:hypothetical protein
MVMLPSIPASKLFMGTTLERTVGCMGVEIAAAEVPLVAACMGLKGMVVMLLFERDGSG